MSHPDAILGALSPADFLRDYWQQRPLLVRQAQPQLATLLDPDELAGLACEEFAEARIVTGHGPKGAWTLQHGPFDDSTFAALGDSNWTLLVQAVDHYVDAVAELKDCFRFLPTWRLDDIMVSFAAPGGSVGPHFDRYDVFLLQGQGHRTWHLGGPCDDTSALLEHPELSLLADFDTRQTYRTGPGDLLYLPPGWAHWGIAEEACVTYSVGFRAPSHAEIVSHYCDAMLAEWRDSRRFQDQQPAPATQPGRIDDTVAVQLRAVVARLLDDPKLMDWFARHMTAPKYDAGDDEFENKPLPTSGIAQLALSSRAAYTDLGGACALYVDGERFDGDGKPWQAFVTALCDQQRVDLSTIAARETPPSVKASAATLWHRGALELAP